VPLYTYKAKNEEGKIVEDVVQASNKKEVVVALKIENLQVLTVKNFESKVRSFFRGGVSTSEKAAFCRFLATMLRAGLPLPEALDIIKQETKSAKLKHILFDAIFHIEKGQTLSSVLAKYKIDFDAVFLTMIKAGEESGTLDKSFDYLSKQLLASHELSQKVKSSLIYPAVIVVAMIGNAFIMLGFVLPKMSDVFLDLNVKMPAVTKFMLNAGKSVGENLALTFGIFFSIIFFVILLFLLRPTRKIILSYLLKLPVVNKVMDQLDTARFARTLSTLLKSGVPIMAALDVCSDVLKQPGLRSQAKEFSSGVAKGKSLSDILVQQKHSFPVTLIQTIRTGEKTGSLELVLEELAIFYELEVDYALKKATALIEPLLMLTIGIAVGGMVILLISPIYSIVGGLESGI